MKPKLNKGLIITFLEDVIVPGTGMTFYYFRGNKYIISEYLDLFPETSKPEPAWKILLINNISNDKYSGNYWGYFSEQELFKKTNCVKYLRKQKLEKINNV